ncbi:MAG: hypothetical protein Q4D98_11490 [Planctomycetia bacterium]|nr:hypothetical protein [Planctomycetia bacterium]
MIVIPNTTEFVFFPSWDAQAAVIPGLGTYPTKETYPPIVTDSYDDEDEDVDDDDLDEDDIPDDDVFEDEDTYEDFDDDFDEDFEDEFDEDYEDLDKIDDDEEEEVGDEPAYEEEFGDVDGETKFIPEGGELGLSEEILLPEDDIEEVVPTPEFDEFDDDADEGFEDFDA